MDMVFSAEVDLQTNGQRHYDTHDLMWFGQWAESDTDDTGNDGYDSANKNADSTEDLRHPMYAERVLPIESQANDCSRENDDECSSKKRGMDYYQSMVSIWLWLHTVISDTVDNRVGQVNILGCWHIGKNDTMFEMCLDGEIGIIGGDSLIRADRPNEWL